MNLRIVHRETISLFDYLIYINYSIFKENRNIRLENKEYLIKILSIKIDHSLELSL